MSKQLKQDMSCREIEAHTGVSKATISRFLNSGHDISLSTAKKLLPVLQNCPCCDQPALPQGPVGWRDISTAPRNHTRVLLYVPPYGVSCGHFDCVWENGVERWIMHSVLNKEAQPTHWVPLPAAPGQPEQPSAKEALQAISDLPTTRDDRVNWGHEEAYRAVEALFNTPPEIHVTEQSSVAEAAQYAKRLIINNTVLAHQIADEVNAGDDKLEPYVRYSAVEHALRRLTQEAE